ncbi:Golgi apparatus protein 1 [Anthonomus grandis grandis]|uniref:Golgi apparatus protein 1 n=1 Tax=Anthonomus grandis grandis TaxID=2921223 RepID=UPI0021653F02|nr:Golgi apparatus protein 1 [Anthonomus grandis grandis]
MLLIYYLTFLILPVLSNKSDNFGNLVQPIKRDHKTFLDDPQCRDVKEKCDKLDDDLSILECIHNLPPKDFNLLNKQCEQLVWEATNKLIKDDNVVEILLPQCRNDMDQLNCRKDEGNYFKCLASAKENIQNSNCQELVQRLENVAFTDYKFIAQFLKQCEDDVKKLSCGAIHSNGLSSQVGTVICLQNNILQVSENCKREVLKLSELQSDNIKLDQQLFSDCAEDYSRYCYRFQPGSGQVFHCLARQQPENLRKQCKDSLFRRQKLISTDYKVSKGLMRSCREDIKKTHCRKQTSSDKTVRLAQILLCLENIDRNGSVISSDCQAELVEHRRMLMEDFRLSPEIVDKCKIETAVFCKGFETGGKTIHCLMKHARDNMQSFGLPCKSALGDLVKKSNVGENWKVDPVLHDACLSVVETTCQDIRSGEARVMNCLMDNIDTDAMTPKCEDALIQIQYFIARKFELDDQLFKACKTDAVRICQVSDEWSNEVGPSYGPEVLPCLYRYMNNPDKDMQLNRSCLQNIRRVMRQRAISVNLEPAIEESCLSDLAVFCHDKVKEKEEMRCLQDNYHDLTDKCKETIGMFTEIQAEHADLNPYINKYCSKIIEVLCNQEAKNDEGDVMECLITHKNDPLIKGNQACRASIEHFQIISLNDYKFSYKFKVACRPYAVRFCGNARTKNEVVQCLSEQVLNATVNGIKSQIPRECKQQLKAQLFQQRENINFDPVLKAACSSDIAKYCSGKKIGNAEVLECLQSEDNQLTEKCEKEVFKVKKQEMYDNSLDYALITLCADVIEQFCPHHSKENVFECLKKNKDEKGFSKKCRQVVGHRIVEQNSNYQLNPTLQQNCNVDINKFCKNALTNHGKETNGVVIKCLKEQFKVSRLSNKCEKEVASILRDQALNVNLNPLIRAMCKFELSTICKSDESEDSGDVEECLKDGLLNSQIQTPQCKIEVANMIEESQADIQVDPLLQQACALDLLHFCSDIPQGNGRHINCLRVMLSANKNLSPKCKNMLKKRLEMYRNAAQLLPESPPEDFKQLYNQVVASPSKQYFFLIFMMFLGTIFIVGIMCGRLNKRKYMLLKSK